MDEELAVQFIVSKDISLEKTFDGGQNNIIINPVNVISSKYIPTSFSFAITIMISNFDKTIEHDFQVSVTASDGKEIFNTGKNQIGPIPHNIDNFSFNLKLDNIDLPVVGTYTITFSFDDGTFTHNFKVKKDE